MPLPRIVLPILLLSVASLSSQQPPQQPAPAANPTPPTATIQVNARQVVLDVVVTDTHGQPVKGLKQSDFTLTEDGAPQTLSSFTERDSVADQLAAPLLPPLPANTFADHAPITNNTAMTVLLFDTSQLSFTDASYARQEAASFLKTVQPGTPMCVFDLDRRGLRLIQDFTTDSKLLRQAVQSKQNAQWLPPPPEVPIFVPRGQALQQLARYLAGFPGRKNLIWFYGINSPELSIGRPGSLFPDTTTFSEDDLKGLTTTLTLNRVALYPVDPRGVIFRWNLQQNITEQNDIFWQGADAQQTAKATGGKAFYDSNGIRQAVAEVVATGSHYYTLSYSPTNPIWNGSFRQLQMRLAGNTTSTGLNTAKLHLEYRTGYYARDTAHPPPSTSPAAVTRKLISYSPKGDPHATSPTTTPLQQAMLFGAVPPFQVLFRAHITPASATAKISRHNQRPAGNYLQTQWLHSRYREYQIHYSVDAEALKFGQPTPMSYQDTLEFLAIVYDDQGNIANSIVTTTPMDFNVNQYLEANRMGVGFNQAIAVPTHGEFYLRVAVHDLNSGRIGALEIPISQIELSPPTGTANSKRGQ